MEDSAIRELSGKTKIVGRTASSKRYAVCIFPRGILSTTSHKRVAPDREPVCRNFRKFQYNVAKLLFSAGVRLTRANEDTPIALLFSLVLYLQLLM